MTEEDEEFNRIERESMMRMKAVEAVVTRGGSRATIEMAREAAGDDWGLFREYMPEIHRLVELVRADERARMAEQPAQQEPVGKIVDCDFVGNSIARFERHLPFGTLLYTSPPAQRKPWVGLTDEDVMSIVFNFDVSSLSLVAKAIEAKLKEKNT